MKRSSSALNFAAGVGYIVLVVALIWLSIAIYNKDFSDDLHVSLSTSDVGTSLQKGSDVEVRGVLVGTVTGVADAKSGARVDMAITRDQVHLLPSNVTATLLPKTLFGERYVNLILPANPTSDRLRSGEVIHQATSPNAVEVQTVLDNLLPVLQAVAPDKLATVLGEIAQAVRGRGAEIGSTLTTVAAYLHKLAPHVPRLTDDLGRLASVARTYSGAAPDLLHALDDLSTTGATIVADKSQLADTFARVTTTSNRLHDFVSANSPDLITLARDSLPTLRLLARYSSEFPCISRTLADFVPVANKALGAGTNRPGLRVTLNIVPSLGKYDAGTDTPSFTSDNGPSCPSSAAGIAGTAASVTGAQGIGTANSPGENELVAELVAPTVGMAPSSFPDWGSLLLGPVLRGASVSVR